MKVTIIKPQSQLYVDSKALRGLDVNRRARMANGAYPSLEPGRKKRKTPKVKTGCYSCRKRHVKCDERRPYCNRCVRYGINCEGYPAGVWTAKELVPVSRPLAPNPTRSRIVPTISPVHAKTQFEDPREEYFFRKYLDIATQIKGPFESSLWQRLIPQSSEAEPYIRDAVIAVGAMNKTLKDLGARDGGSHSLQLCENPDYIYALKKYDKALRGMRDAIKDGKANVRNAFFACLLVFCFENMSGKPGAAAANAISGLMVCYQWLLENQEDYVPGHFRSRCREHGIDEDIVTALNGLDLHVVFFIDQRPEYMHQVYIAGLNGMINRMPEELPTLQEARNFWSAIMSRNYHFIRTVLDVRLPADPNKPGDHDHDTPFEEGTNLSPGVNIFFALKEPPKEMYSDVLRYGESVRRWKRASATVFDQALKSGTQEEKTVVCLLQIHELMAYIMLKGCFFTTQTEYDVFFPEYRSIMDLVEYVYPHLATAEDGEPLYRFDLGIIIAMFLVSVRCRDKATRDRAVRMLNLNKEYREGMWDTGSAGTIVSWLREIEEEMRDENGEIGEENRFSVTNAHLDLPCRRGIIRVSQRSKEGRLVFREKEFSW